MVKLPSRDQNQPIHDGRVVAALRGAEFYYGDTDLDASAELLRYLASGGDLTEKVREALVDALQPSGTSPIVCTFKRRMTGRPPVNSISIENFNLGIEILERINKAVKFESVLEDIGHQSDLGRTKLIQLYRLAKIHFIGGYVSDYIRNGMDVLLAIRFIAHDYRNVLPPALEAAIDEVSNYYSEYQRKEDEDFYA